MPVTDTLEVKTVQYELLHVVIKRTLATMYLVKFLSDHPRVGVLTVILLLHFYA